ncbi:ABC transporter substrate-binding protein [Bradyrhizobium sp. AUGA SZCCT0182]|uniref:ABC transporter substrate-binding protein n=1 Tax=Bradyrhizobium sp. AUGA SZCCT0182 TaxID=2807667 RepID=UPI0020130951|nr:ABC transporter substrate-binding protein [Bradyrhizobium sp. AUGA SZCCT0182]
MKQSFVCCLAALSIAFGSLVATQPVAGQQAEKTYSVGILCGGCSDADPARRFAETRQALRERGYFEGRNIAFVYRSAEGRYEKLPGLAADLVRAKVDVIMAGGGLPGALAVKNATTTIPIIFVGIGEDPVQHGLVSSLSRPGGNVTGLVDRYADLIPKQLALLKEAVPGLSRVGVLWDARLRQALEPSFEAMQTALPSLGLQHYAIAVNRADDLPDAFRAASRARVEALILFPSPQFFDHLAEFARMTAAQKIPAISGFTDFARAGGFLSYGPNAAKTWRYAAISVDKILKGTSPADIPVEQSDNIDLVVNLQTARALGLIVPQALLVSANEVID